MLGIRTVMRKFLLITLLGSVAALLPGCGLHLHRPSDETQARAASDGFKDLKLDAAIAAARINAAALTAAELETRRTFGEMLVRRDLLSVLAFEPAGASELPRGWPKLVKETYDALAKYGIVSGTPRKFTPKGVSELRLITRRLENADNLDLELRVYKSFLKTYELLDKSGTLTTDCTKLPLPQPPLEMPPDVKPEKWNYYNTNIVPACERVWKARGDLEEMEKILQRNPEYRSLAKQIGCLEKAVKDNKERATEITNQYEKAKSELANAEASLAKATVAAQTEEAKKQVDVIKGDVTKATRDLSAALEAAKPNPLLAAAVKTDVLAEIVANAKFLSGDDTAGAHETTKVLVAALNRYPDIKGRLSAAQEPGVNVFLLELALQRLEYEKLVNEQAANQDVLTLVRNKRETLIETTAAWGRVMELLERPEKDFTEKLKQRLEKETVIAVLPVSPIIVRQAVVNYVAAKLLEDADMPVFDVQLADGYYRMSLDFSETALRARDDLIRAPLQEITTYHEGGIRSEEVAALLHAIGLGAIAIGVNR